MDAVEQRDRILGLVGLQLADQMKCDAGMGFTQLWLNPVLENAQPDASYHGYAITDFYRVDPRLGSNEGFRQLVREARERNVGVIMDVVLNHIGSSHWWMRDPPAPDWINYGGKFTATHHVRESLQDPHGAEADRRLFSDGWFVETMPDLNQRNPFLATYLIQNTLWWIEYAGLSGLRVVMPPTAEIIPSSPSIRRTVMLGLVAGLVLALGVILFREYRASLPPPPGPQDTGAAA